MVAEISPNERLARFIFSSGHFSREKKRIKSAAFFPKGEEGLSVSRISSLNLQAVREIGCGIADKRPGNTFYGWGEFLASIAQVPPFRIRPDEPPEYHALIEGWSTEKEEKMTQAQRLADQATLCLALHPYRGVVKSEHL